MRLLPDKSVSNLLNIFFRIVQLVLALVTVGLYAYDLNRARKEHKYSDGKWVFAVVVCSFSAITALVFALISVFSEYRRVAMCFAWDTILLILWAAVSGIFGNMYLGEKTEMEYGIHRMKVAVGFDLAQLVLWFLTALMGAIGFFTMGRRTLHTGRGMK